MPRQQQPASPAPRPHLMVVATEQDFGTVVEGYRLGPHRVTRYDHYEDAVRDVLRRRHEGLPANFITVGHDARDVLRLKPLMPNKRRTKPREGELGARVSDLAHGYLEDLLPLRRDEAAQKPPRWADLVTREP